LIALPNWVQTNTQNSLHLAAAIRVGDAAKALALIAQFQPQ